MCACSPLVNSPLLYHEARLTVFHEEVSGAVGISDGLSSPVQFHHVGTEDVYVVLALVEQPLGAPLLGDNRQQEMRKRVCGIYILSQGGPAALSWSCRGCVWKMVSPPSPATFLSLQVSGVSLHSGLVN